MSEFKFACPICGQHLTADSKDTGSQISCPTCYRKIVVPQAPTLAEPKFVISASEANKPRPTTTIAPLPGPIPAAPAKPAIPPALIVLLVLACASGATLFLLTGKIFHGKPPNARAQTDASKVETHAQPEFTGTSRWTLDLTNSEFPDAPVSGAIHNRAFTVERATLNVSNLTFRIGRMGPIELGVNVAFFNRQPEELSGKTAMIKPTDPKAPRVGLHWMAPDRQSQTFYGGYAMKVEFGAISNNVLPGKIFLCVPDDDKSWVAGTFRAEIRRGPPFRGRPPNAP
jgi:DNA-directed RNA polymerase subunit RPC12/RpoP